MPVFFPSAVFLFLISQGSHGSVIFSMTLKPPHFPTQPPNASNDLVLKTHDFSSFPRFPSLKQKYNSSFSNFQPYTSILKQQGSFSKKEKFCEGSLLLVPPFPQFTLSWVVSLHLNLSQGRGSTDMREEGRNPVKSTNDHTASPSSSHGPA